MADLQHRRGAAGGSQAQHVARWTLAIVALTLACGCAESEAYAIGPTIDGAGQLGFELRGAAGPVTNGNRTLIPPYAAPQPESLWIMGLSVAVGATTYPHAWASFAPYVEYLRLGSPEQPWGWHAGASLGASAWEGGSMGLLIGQELVVALYSGPQYLRSQIAQDTNDGTTEISDLSGADLELRLPLWPTAASARNPEHPVPLRASRWRLGLLYVGQQVTLY